MTEKSRVVLRSIWEERGVANFFHALDFSRLGELFYASFAL